MYKFKRGDKVIVVRTDLFECQHNYSSQLGLKGAIINITNEIMEGIDRTVYELEGEIVNNISSCFVEGELELCTENCKVCKHRLHSITN